MYSVKQYTSYVRPSLRNYIASSYRATEFRYISNIYELYLAFGQDRPVPIRSMECLYERGLARSASGAPFTPTRNNAPRMNNMHYSD